MSEHVKIEEWMPCCGLEILFQWGPEAGLSRNARCCHCHSIFCVSPFGWELVEKGILWDFGC